MRISLRSQVINYVQQRGVTLIELMIAITLALILAFAVGIVVLTNARVYRHEASVAAMTHAANTVFEVLNNQVRHTGFGEITPLNTVTQFEDVSTAFFIFGVDACMDLPCVTGPLTNPDALITVQQVQGTDPSSNLPLGHDAAAGTGGDCNNSNPNGIAAVPQGVVAINMHFVRINPVTGIRELVCVGNANPGVPVALVENIEDLQFYFGLTRNERIPPRQLSNETTPLVRFVNICLVMSSGDEILSEPMGNKPTCSDDPAIEPTEILATDRRLYRKFNYTVQLRNRNQGVNPT